MLCLITSEDARLLAVVSMDITFCNCAVKVYDIRPTCVGRKSYVLVMRQNGLTPLHPYR